MKPISCIFGFHTKEHLTYLEPYAIGEITFKNETKQDIWQTHELEVCKKCRVVFLN